MTTLEEAFTRIDKAANEHMRSEPPTSIEEAREHWRTVERAKAAVLAVVLTEEVLS